MGDNVVLTEDVIILAHDYSYEVLENIEEASIIASTKIYQNRE